MEQRIVDEVRNRHAFQEHLVHELNLKLSSLAKDPRLALEAFHWTPLSLPMAEHLMAEGIQALRE